MLPVVMALVLIAVVVWLASLSGVMNFKDVGKNPFDVATLNVFSNEDLRFTVNGVSFVMKPVQGGTFNMGSADYDAESDESPVHSVSITSFYMGETEVTQALWQAVMGTNLDQQRNKKGLSEPLRGVGDNYPMYYVNWDECQEFIKKLNQLTGKNFRLPTEAEWEYAARGGNIGTGRKYAGSDFLSDVAWFADNSFTSTHPIKSKGPNELGIYDMSGNVWEWCSDRYSSSYYYTSPYANPQGESSGTTRVLRGGSWYSPLASCRVTKRHKLVSYYRDTCYGFRLVLRNN